MRRHLVLFIVVFFLLVYWFIKYYDYLRVWITHFFSQPSIAKRKRKNKSRPCPFPAKKPDCPLCQASQNLA